MSLFEKDKIAYIFDIYLLPLLLFVVGYWIFGFYWWIDDVIFQIFVSGILDSGPITGFNHLIGLSKLYVKLYQLLPNVPWYGLFLYSFMYLATTNLFKAFRFVLRQFNFRKGLPVTMLLIILFLLIQFGNVFRITHTGVAILLVGSSLLVLIMHSINNKKISFLQLAYYGCLFIFGLLTRPDAGIFITIILVGFYFMTMGIKLRSFKTGIPFLAFSLLAMIFYILNERHFAKTRPEYPVWKYSFTYQNAYLTKENIEFEDKAEYLKYQAFSWSFFGDRYAFTKELLDKITYPTPFNKAGLMQWKKKLKLAYERATRFPDEYQKGYNYLYKTIALFFLNMLVVIMALLGLLNSRKNFFRFLLFQVGFWLIFILLAIFIKIEDYLMFPAITIYFTGNLMVVGNLIANQRLSLEKIKLTITLFILLSSLYIIQRLVTDYDIAKEKRQELQLKKEIIEEINSFHNKFLVLDFFSSMALLHQDPFHNVYIAKDITLFAFGEFWLSYFDTYQEYLKKLCGSDRMDAVFRYLYRNKEDVIFVYGDYKMEFTKQYLEYVYGQCYEFKEIKKGSKLNQLKYSFMEYPYPLHYYKFYPLSK